MDKKQLRKKLAKLIDKAYGKIGTKKRDELEHKASVEMLTKDTPIIKN